MTLKDTVYYFIFPVLGLLCFSLIVFWQTGGVINQTSYWKTQVECFASINQTLSQWRVLFENLTQLGNALILMPIVSLLIVRRPQVWAGLLGAIPLGVLLSVGGKYWLAVPRPGVVLDPVMYPAVGLLKGYHSLPSGHTITIFAVVAVILLVLIPMPRSRAQFGMLTFGMLTATLIALSRVAVGVHWPLDIVAGSALGFLAGVSGVMLSQRYQKGWQWLTAEKYQFLLGAMMLTWSAGLFRRVIKQSDNTDIIIWIAAISGLITATYLLKQSAAYYLNNA